MHIRKEGDPYLQTLLVQGAQRASIEKAKSSGEYMMATEYVVAKVAA